MKKDFDKEKKIYRDVLVGLFYLYYKDFSLDELNSRLLELYQDNSLFKFLEISFLEILIEIRSEDINYLFPLS